MKIVNIADKDQNIVVQTCILDEQMTSITSKDISEKQSLVQEIQTSFPVFVYNIGNKKLIIQNTLKQGTSYVYTLSAYEYFFGFVEYHRLSSLGFNSSNFNIEGSSQVVFLTRNMKTNHVNINLLLVDPYYDPCNIVLFKSLRFFELASCD